MISSRAIALQGIGFAAALIAIQGFAPTDVEVVVPQPVSAQVPASGGGASYDGGQGYIKKDHGWVKATKWSKFGAWDFGALVSVSAEQKAPIEPLFARSYEGAADAKSTVSLLTERCSANSHAAAVEASSFVAHEETLQSAQATDHTVIVDYLSGDELMILLEYA